MCGSTEPRHPEQNHLLRALPPSDYRRLLPDLQEVSLANGRVLFEARERITHVYFPQHCVVSLLTAMDGERGVEVAIVGNEGMVGLSVFLGAASATSRAVAQVPDSARRLTVAAFRRALSRGPALRRIMLRYADAMLSQIAQSAACIQRHPVEQRCARWLLMAHDRVGADHLLLTQEFLGQMLDVRRPTVSAARRVQDAGAIRYSRGRITVTGRARLEQASCACYRIVEQDYTRTFTSS
jgi:CRP-like cAMP-binding protein